MADSTDVLLKLCEQRWAEVKQAEDQRSALSNIILLIASAIVGVFTQKGLDRNNLPLSLLLIFLGIYGAIGSRKYRERIHYSLSILKLYRDKLDELYPDAQIEKLRIQAKDFHEKRHPLMTKIYPHQLWVALHISIAIAGLILTIIVLRL
ncbi:hypothetical protein [Leptolyngbya sp. FACHB-261]|uniref:hypothetical protein n=1 Tax=Leptolyngbya sp. FACHB-261 TaxID=2692806 RepID=UPI001687E1C8|nr:hypothetical protein [Leptolyngbya sp. FACHB-261]MBD2104681.1 hypothetical protein [Leptolyngbya sp. FACHB-261]